MSVAKPALKNQKKREQKKIEEVCYCLSATLFYNLFLGHKGVTHENYMQEKLIGIFRKRDKNSKSQKTRPEDRVLRATAGHFKNGILDVKHLLGPSKPSGRDIPEPKMRKSKHKGKGKQKGGRRKRR